MADDQDPNEKKANAFTELVWAIGKEFLRGGAKAVQAAGLLDFMEDNPGTASTAPIQAAHEHNICRVCCGTYSAGAVRFEGRQGSVTPCCFCEGDGNDTPFRTPRQDIKPVYCKGHG